MRWFLILWIGPIGFLGAWYGLSYNDINFGTLFFSRQMHDLVFGIYGNVLGIAPEAIPPLVLKALIVDTMLVLSIMAFRRRRKIADWVRARWGVRSSGVEASGDPVERPLQDEGRGSRIDAAGSLRPRHVGLQ